MSQERLPAEGLTGKHELSVL